MAEKEPKVSIGVSSWNTSDIIEASLDSIVETVGDLEVDVTVIDDGSTDGGFAPVAEKFKNDPRFLFLRHEDNRGVPSLNAALERSQAKYILTLDSDARLVPGTLQKLYDFMEAHPEAGGATANLVFPDGSPQFYFRRIYTPMRYFFTTPIGRVIDKYFLGLRNFNSYHYTDLDLAHDPVVEQCPTACLLLRREVLGPYIFDPIFRVFMPDVDLGKRIYDKGYKMYLVSSAKAIHLKSASNSKRGRTWIDNEVRTSSMLYFKKHYPLWYPFLRIVAVLDRLIRKIMLATIGREPAV
jgi:GT2 family glycosyltransferase